MNVVKYDSNKFRKIVSTTLSNYANMIKRLEKRKKISEFVLIYYSIFLIMTTLTGKYFPETYNLVLSEYFNIIISVIVLIYSLINKNANYSSRLDVLLSSLNALKTIKRMVDDNNVNKYNDQYNKIVDNTERRDDVDFFITVKQLCKEHNINWITKKSKKINIDNIPNEEAEEQNRQQKVVNKYISEINVFVQEGKIILSVIWDIIIIAIPVLLFVICMCL